MSVVMVLCPKTGIPLHTGMHAHWVDFNRMPNFTRDVACPACREVHQWSRSQAMLVDPSSSHPAQPAKVTTRTLRLVG